MTTLLVTVFVASLVGSLHCAGMCGGFVVFYAGSAPRGARRILSHVAYNGGRFLTYALLGLLAGFLGAALDVAGTLVGAQRIAAVLAGVVIFLWGIVGLLRARGAEIFKTLLPDGVERLSARVLRALTDCPPVLRALIIGLLTTFLPCGWLYWFVISAAGTGNALNGLMVMMAFWAGTVPVLLGLGLGVQAVAGPLRKKLPTAVAVALLVVGLVLVFGRIDKIGIQVGGGNDKPATLEEAVDLVRDVDDKKMPCCNGHDKDRK